MHPRIGDERVEVDTGRSGRLRALAVVATIVAAVGSLALLLVATTQRHHTPPFLVVLMIGWVLLPFVALIVAARVSVHWSQLPRNTLYTVMLLVSAAALVAYAADAVWPPRARAAFVYVMVPMASWLLLAVAVPIAALVSYQRARHR